MNIYVKTVFSSHMEIVFSSNTDVLHKWSHSPDCILNFMTQNERKRDWSKMSRGMLGLSVTFLPNKSENKATHYGKGKKTTTV